MTRFEVETLAAANPLSLEEAERLPLDAAERDMLERICVAEPVRASTRPRRARRGRRLALVAAVASAAVIALATLPSDHGEGGAGPAPAFAAELVHFANASPLVLLDAPGWHVIYANELSAEEGEMHFQHGPGSVVASPYRGTPPGRESELFWRLGPLSGWVNDRAASASARSTAPVLGTIAQIFQYAGGQPGDRDITALWMFGGRVLEYRAQVRDMSAFKLQLGALRRVDTTRWLRAMPESVITTSHRGEVVRQMLKGIPLPPGFTPAQIHGSELTSDRYQLGAAVSGTVACSWFAIWSQARHTGDGATVRRAIAAMATAEHWPILREMASEGGYTSVLVGYAKAMPSGRWAGRPLEGDVDSGLGCSELGVRLSTPRSPLAVRGPHALINP